MPAKEIAKRNDVLRRSIPSQCKGFRFTSSKSCLLITSYYTDVVRRKHFYFSRKKRGSSQSLHRYQKVHSLQSFGFLKNPKEDSLESTQTCYQHCPVRGAITPMSTIECSLLWLKAWITDLTPDIVGYFPAL